MATYSSAIIDKCCVCGKVLGEKDGKGKSGISHGYCLNCFQRAGNGMEFIIVFRGYSNADGTIRVECYTNDSGDEGSCSQTAPSTVTIKNREKFDSLFGKSARGFMSQKSVYLDGKKL